MIYNLDTSIWLDFGMKRGENGESALKLIIKIIEENSIIIYSNIHIKELEDSTKKWAFKNYILKKLRKKALM